MVVHYYPDTANKVACETCGKEGRPATFRPVYRKLVQPDAGELSSPALIEKFTVASYDCPVNIQNNCIVCKEGTPVDHFGSSLCRSGSIASGGSNAHCTCDTCF